MDRSKTWNFNGDVGVHHRAPKRNPLESLESMDIYWIVREWMGDDGGILMVNVIIYSIHGSYGILIHGRV